ncbi:hypothetical protein, variant 3 [Exophiala oligosperma]|uniref:Protein kinase domain-containing protein n=1 Tax=Exophiala oligosperma TaxID=215243 RepID=A0A0D2BFM3_9EURO|nr:hypothetical protein, variant 2 [Exophiala oligosperma]XP_016256519.1 hypothetical protein, variant 3 [Exophiala oligosperma]KIW36302.1 hypothetical protein, variant 2 [Exophiala oligosperma]KIW36303.1 hypothetical protein, variant 3 [Exophiala oligosperma]
MDELNTFLILTPFDEWGLTIDSFRLPHNADRYVKPSPISRGTTPSEYGEDETPANELDYFHRIQLRFDQETKVKGRVIFGSDPDQCDVLLESTRPRFYISFDSEQRPAIWDNSNNGLTVSYDGEAKDELRHHFKWIFFPGYETIRVKIPLRNNRELAFNVHLPRHYETRPNEYNDNVERFMDGAPPSHEVDFYSLALGSPGDSFAPSESLSPSRRPVYLKREELGHGAYGRVRRVLNATTGLECAGKEFFYPSGWQREIEIMKTLRHDHIVGFIDFKTHPKPLMVTEYLPLGNLSRQNSISPIAVEEWVTLLHQCLKALEYLHARNVTHRDLKPENILVKSRTPFLVRVGDFGLAKKDIDLRTRCGNYRYSPPEVYSNRPYTCVVDIWQLGVIVLEGLYGLPEVPRDAPPKDVKERRKTQRQAFTWCSSIVEAAEDWESDPMIDFLKSHMLKWEPTDRQSAAECLSMAYDIGLFEEIPLRTGSLTPRREPAQVHDDIDAEDASTIKEPFGKIGGTAASHEGHTSQPENGSPSPGERHSDRSVKRRRTTNDFDPSLNFPGWSFDLGDVSQITPDESLKALLDSADNGAKQAESIHGSIQSDSSDNPPIAPPLEKHGQFVVQNSGRHRGILHVPDARLNFTMDTSATGPWIDLPTARGLCAMANLDDDFRPLLSFGEAQEGQRAQKTPILSDPLQMEQREKIPSYTKLIFEDRTILIRDQDLWINASQVFRAAGFDEPPFSWPNQKFNYDVVDSLGVFVESDVAINLCNLYSLQALGAILHERTRVMKVTHTRQSQHFHFLECDNDVVAVRRRDFSVNLTHILKASSAHPSHRDTLQRFKRRLPSIEVVRGDPKIQGSYAHISLAVNLSCLLGLTLITKALLELISTRDAQGKKVFGDDGLCPDEGPSNTAQPGNVSRDGPRQDGLFECDGDFGPEMNFSEIDRQLQLSRPSFRFMTPTPPSQTSPLRMSNLQAVKGMTTTLECDNQIDLSSIQFPFDLSCLKPTESRELSEHKSGARSSCLDRGVRGSSVQTMTRRKQGQSKRVLF